MQKIQSLQIFRAFAAIMVVFFHAHSYMLPHKIEDGASVFRGFNMGYAGVEIFFVISGFIMFYIHRNDIGKPSTYLSYAYKRVVRIYPVYLLVLAALVGLYFIVPGSGPENARNIPEILLSATLLPTSFKPVMEVAWTLQFEMFFYLMFSLLIANRKIGQGVFVLWGVGCLINLFINTEILPLSFVFSAYNLLFMMGAIGAYVLHNAPPPARYSVGIFGLGLLLYLGVGMVESYGVIEWYAPLRTVLYGIGTFLMMAILFKEKYASISYPKPLLLLGDASYSIYLVHAPCMMITAELLNRVGIMTMLPSVVMFYLIVVFSILSSVVFYFIIEKNIINYFKRLSTAQNFFGK